MERPRVRAAQDLYHAAFEVSVPEGRFVIEMAPAWSGGGVERGVVGEGAVGTRWVGRSRLFGTRSAELAADEMWNSNSVVAWLLARAGLLCDGIGPPSGGRAPGWHAGLVVARRDVEAPVATFST